MGKKPWKAPETDDVVSDATSAEMTVWKAPDTDEVIEVKKKGQGDVSQPSNEPTSLPGQVDLSKPVEPQSKPSAEPIKTGMSPDIRGEGTIFKGLFDLGRKAISTIKDEMVGAYYTEKAIQKKTDFIDELIRTQPEKYAVANEYASPETRRAYAEKQADKEYPGWREGKDVLTTEGKVVKTGTSYDTAAMKEKKALLTEAEKQRAEGAEFTKGIPQSWEEATAKGPDGISSYIGSAIGNGLAQIPASALTLGTSSYFMEKTGAYDEAVNAIAKESGLTPDQVIEQGKDQPAKEIAHTIGLINGGIDLASSVFTAGKGIATGIKQIIKKKATEELLRAAPEAMWKKGAKAIAAPMLEYGTEFAQGTNTQIGALVAAGKDINDIDWEKDIDWDRSREEGLQGLFGSLGVVGASKLISRPASEVIKTEQAAITSPTDAPAIDKAADAILENVKQKTDETITAEKTGVKDVSGETPVESINPDTTVTGNTTIPVIQPEGTGVSSGTDITKQSGLTEIDDAEVERQVRPYAEKLVDIERQFANQGYTIDMHYDNETLVQDKNGDIIEPTDLPENLQKLAGSYEEATAALGSITPKYGAILNKVREEQKGVEVPFTEVKNELNQSTEGITNADQNQQRLPGEKRGGQELEQAKPDEGTGGEATTSGRVLQESQNKQPEVVNEKGTNISATQPAAISAEIPAGNSGSTVSSDTQRTPVQTIPESGGNGKEPPVSNNNPESKLGESHIYNNAAIYTGETGETGSVIKPELSKGFGGMYGKISQENTIGEAKRIVTSHPAELVEKTVFDRSNDMDEALRVATALELAVSMKDKGDRRGAQRIFDQYREMGTKSGQAQQMRTIARDNPKIQVLDIVAKAESDNREIRLTRQQDGETTGKKLDDTYRNLVGLADQYGVQISETDEVDAIIEKILSKGLPKSERVQQAQKRLKDAASKLRQVWDANKVQGIIWDPKSQAKKQIQLEKAVLEYIGAVVEKFVVEAGDKIGNIASKVTEQVRAFLDSIGLTIQDKELKDLIDRQIADEQRKYRYTPPITETERREAVQKISNLLLPKTGQKAASTKPAIQEFYERLVKKMVGGNDKLKGKSPEKILDEVLKNLDKYTAVLEGVRDEMAANGVDVSDVQSIFDLPYFEKQVQKNVTAIEVKKLIKEHFSVKQAAAQSLADKLIQQYGLTSKDALSVERVVKAEFDKRIKDQAQKELTKLYGSSRLTQPKSATKGDAQKIIEAINMGAFNEDFYADLVGQKFGIVNLTDQDIAMMEQLADKVQKLPPGERRNNALRDFMTYTEGLQNPDKLQAFFKNTMDLWYRSALSGYSTQARSLKGAAVQASMNLFVASLANPVATLYGMRGFKALYRGLANSGPRTWWHIFRTGQNTFGAEQPRPRTWWQKVAETPYNALVKDRSYGSVLAKTWAAPLNVMWNGMIATDAMFRYTMKEYENYVAEYNRLLNEGGSRFETEFWNKLNQRLAIDEVGQNAAKAQLEQELDAMRANNEAIPSGYERRRYAEIIEGKRDQEWIGYAVDKANESVLMNDPVGTLGALYRLMVKAGEMDPAIKEFEKNKGYQSYRKAKMVGKFVYRQIFPFLRVATNYINRTLDFTPVGFVRAYAGGRQTSTGWKEMTPDERSRHLVMGAVGATVVSGLAMSLFDLDDDEGLILDPDCPIRVTGLGLGPGKYQENRDIDPTRQDLSFQIRWPDGSWSDWYTYRDNSLGMVLYPLGQASDDLRFKKFKELAKDERADERSVGTYLGTALNWSVQFATAMSYQQGIRNLLDLISFDERSSNNEKAIKAMISPAKGIAVPNLYRQTYQQAKALLDQPEKKAYGLIDQIEKDVPLVESLMDNEAYDQLGYPIVRDFDWPLVPDYVLEMVKQNRISRMTKPEWQLVYKFPEVTLGDRFKAPDQIAKEDFIRLNIPWMKKDKKYIELSDADKNQFVKSAGEHLRSYIHDNLTYLNKLDALSLQRKFNDYRAQAYKDAKIEVSGQSLNSMVNKMTDIDLGQNR